MSRIIPFTDPLQGSAKVAHEVAHPGNYALPAISDADLMPRLKRQSDDIE